MTAAVTSRKKATTKRSPKAAPVETGLIAEEPAELSDEELAALATEIEDGVDDGGVRPVVIGKRGRRGDRKVEMVRIFEIDGAPSLGFIPKEPSPALVLKYMVELRKGREIAIESMAVALLGEQNFAALAASPEVEAEDMEDVFTNVGVVFFGSETYRTIFGAAGN